MAEVKSTVHSNGNLNELQNWKYQQLASDPVSPVEGQFWYNTSENRLKHYDGISVVAVAVLPDLTSALKWAGGYDANTNTPDLEAPAPGAVKQGFFYYVTAAGNFFTEPVEIGDALIANIDDPSALSDWTRVQFNVDQATETIRGVAKIATQAQTDAGVDDTTIVTPLKLANATSISGVVKKFAVDLDSAEGTVTRSFAGGVTTFVVTHSLNTLDVQTEVREISTGKQTLFEVESTTVNTITIRGNGSIVDDLYRTVIEG